MSSFLSVNFNMAEATGLRSLRTTTARLSTSLEKLATGKKINRASDDPSGLIAAEKFKAERETLKRQLEQMGQEYYRYSALEGGLAGVNDQLVELQSLVTTAASSGALADGERRALQVQADAVVEGILFASQTVRYKGELLLDGYVGNGARLSVRAESEAPTEMMIGGALRSLKSGGAHNLLGSEIEDAQKMVDALVNSIAGGRAAASAQMKGLESSMREMMSRDENLAAALSGLIDTDYAKETGELVRTQVLQQASIATVQIARELQANTVLELVKDQIETAKEVSREGGERTV
jgi:flagellin